MGPGWKNYRHHKTRLLFHLPNVMKLRDRKIAYRLVEISATIAGETNPLSITAWQITC